MEPALHLLTQPSGVGREHKREKQVLWIWGYCPGLAGWAPFSR